MVNLLFDPGLSEYSHSIILAESLGQYTTLQFSFHLLLLFISSSVGGEDLAHSAFCNTYFIFCAYSAYSIAGLDSLENTIDVHSFSTAPYTLEDICGSCLSMIEIHDECRRPTCMQVTETTPEYKLVLQ